MIDEVHQDVARAVRAGGSPLPVGMLLALDEIDEYMGGADSWDRKIICEGLVFAVVDDDLDDGAGGVAAEVLPELTERVYAEAHGDDTGPGATGRALARVVLAIKGGNWPADVTELVHDPKSRLAALGFASEAWAVDRPTEEDAPSTGWIRDQPDSVEIRFVTIVDLDGAEYVQVRVRGREPEQGVWPPGLPHGGFGGPVQRALRVLANTLTRPAKTTTN